MEQKTKNKKIVKIIGFILLLIILMATVTSGVFLFLKKINEKETFAESLYVRILEDGTYYISKAKKDITFEIDSSDNPSYKLYDKNNNTVNNHVIEKNGRTFIKADEFYQEGETYTLELTDAKFKEESLKDAKKVIFKIEEPEKADYKFSEQVKILEEDIVKEDEDTIKLPNENIRENDIILVKNDEQENDFKEAYKIENIENDYATVSTPEVAEIYDTFDLYYEKKVSFENFKVDKEMEDKIELAVKKSALYQFLVNESYAADDVSVKPKITVNGEQLTIEIMITVKANGQEFLGIKALANHNLTLNFKIDIGCDMITDLEKNVGLNLDMSLTQKFGFQISLESNADIIEGVDELTDDEYLKSIQEIVEKLENATSDKTEGRMPIGGVEVPTGIVGVNAYFDIYLQTELALKINLTYDQTIETVEHIGIIMNENATTPYFNVSEPNSNINISVYGKADMRLGVGFDIGISIISKDLAHVGIGEEGGLYGELFASMETAYDSQSANISDSFVGNLEAGLYFKTNFSAGIDIFFFKASYANSLAEVKIPILKLNKNYDASSNTEHSETEDNTSSQSKPNTNNQANTSPNANTSSTTGTESGVVGSLSINAESESIKAYKKYILDKKYVDDYKNYLQEEGWNNNILKDVGYCIFDINQDGIPELLIDSADDFDQAWRINALYTYNPSNKSVTNIKLLYNYGGFRYEKNEHELVYTNIRPTYVTGFYEFYKLENNALVHIKTVAHDRGSYDIYTDTYEYEKHMVWYGNEEETYITQEEESAYFDHVIDFSYQDITKVK